MEIIIDKLIGKNFKGVSSFEINFSPKMEIRGRNATGKTSVFDLWCWIVTGKNSAGEQKFDIREIDTDGQKVHQTEISGIAEIRVDGNPIVLKRTQTEKWVKKRGQEEQELSGNTDSYEINGFPKSKKEYDSFISELVEEKTFRIFSSPVNFPELDWKEQRKLLMSLVEIDPDEIGKDVPYFELIREDLMQESPDAVKKKYAFEKKRYKEAQERVPIEIDTLHDQYVEVNQKQVAEEEAEVSRKLEDIQFQIDELKKRSNSLLEAKIMECQTQQRIIVATANDSRNSAIRSAKSAYEKAQNEYDSLSFSIANAESNLRRKQNNLDNLNAECSEKLEAYNKLKDETFPEGESVCSRCGQPLPKKMLDKAKADWEKRHKDQVDRQKDSGNYLVKEIRKLEKDIAESNTSLESSRTSLAEMGKYLEECQKAYEDAKNAPVSNGTDSQEFNELSEKIQKYKEQLAEVDKAREEIKSLEAEKAVQMHNLAEVHEKQAQIKANRRIEEQIIEKRESLKEIAEKYARCDQRLFALEAYVKSIAEKINSQFDGLKFKLFESQINGGIADCCEITYNGVPFSSLNSGHKIVIGLEVIKAFQKIYDMRLPVWIDNAESLSPDNVPEVDSQLILLRVTDDPKLTITHI